MSKIAVREVDGFEEHDTLIELQRQCLPTSPLYEPDRGFWWIAYDERGMAVAFAGLTDLRDGSGYLCRSGVLPSHRGHHLQRRLIQARERKARTVGLKTLITDTTLNPASVNSLIGCGFKNYEPQNPWAFRETNYWKKTIAPHAA